MSVVHVVAALSLLMAASCHSIGDRDRDLSPPRLLSSSLDPEREQIPTDPIVVTFSEDVDPASARSTSAVVIPYRLLGACSTELACDAGDRCHHGRCQRSPVSQAFVGDLAHQPLTPSHLAQVAPATVRVEGPELAWEPLQPLAAHRLHALLVGPGLADGAGNRIEPEPPSRLLLDQVFATASAETGRPLLALISPVDGAVEVPVNLKRALVGFSRPVLGVEPESLFLRRPDGRRVAARIAVTPARCDGRPLGTCFELLLREPLPPRQRIELAITEAVRDLRGQRVLMGRAPAFATAAEPDASPPDAAPVRVQVSDRCAVVRLRLGEPADLVVRPGWTGERWSLARDLHELALPAPAGNAGGLRATVEDLAGNGVALDPAFVLPGDSTPRVVITEVLANPSGPEPAQEFVELLNLDTVPVSLEGWVLDDNDDGSGSSRLPAVVLQPGQLAVVVGPKLDTSLLDPPLAQGALLVRLGATLGQAGLSNGGEPLVLRDPRGRLVSSYLGKAGTASDGCSVERIDPAGCDTMDNWRPEPSGRSSAGRLPSR